MNEAKLYELLGVKAFRKMVFLLEKISHRNTGKQNVNYHLATKSPNALNQFIKFLFYNGSIHVRNVIYVALYFTIRLCFIHFTGHTPSIFSKILDVIILILLVKDLYCIMLQRYNYLRIRKRQKTLELRLQTNIQKQVVSHLQHFSEAYDIKHKDHDLEVIKKMRESIAKGELVFLSDEDIETLRRLSNAMSGVHHHTPKAKQDAEELIEEQ